MSELKAEMTGALERGDITEERAYEILDAPQPMKCFATTHISETIVPARSLDEVVAELRNALTPIMLLPESYAVGPDTDWQDWQEALLDATESRPRIHALLNELSTIARGK